MEMKLECAASGMFDSNIDAAGLAHKILSSMSAACDGIIRVNDQELLTILNIITKNSDVDHSEALEYVNTLVIRTCERCHVLAENTLVCVMMMMMMCRLYSALYKMSIVNNN